MTRPPAAHRSDVARRTRGDAGGRPSSGPSFARSDDRRSRPSVSRGVLRTLAAIAAASALATGAVAQTRPGESAVVDWARRSSTPLAGDSTAAVRALAALAADAKVIGVGESVHNVHEFLTIRFLLLRHLVESGRVSALALESGLPEGLDLDAYVTGRAPTVDYDTAINYGFGSYPEVRAAFEWLREWNLSHPSRPPVRVLGIDLPGSAGSMVPALDRLVAYYDRVDPAEAEWVRARLRPLAEQASGPFWQPAIQRYLALTAPARDSLRRISAGLAERLRAKERDYRAASSDGEYRWALRIAIVATQTEEMLRLGAFDASNPRDRAMAANALWALEDEGKGGMMIWAHNAHVQTARIAGQPVPVPGGVPNLGLGLRDALGARYVALGFSYGGPSLDSTTAPVAGSVDAMLATVSNAAFLLPLAGASREASAWLGQPHPMRFQAGHLELRPSEAFTALIHVPRATPAEAVR
ncbi:MAG: erythromycin esterase family protein [Gemmatimonadales bacterium]